MKKIYKYTLISINYMMSIFIILLLLSIITVMFIDIGLNCLSIILAPILIGSTYVYIKRLIHFHKKYFINKDFN